MLIALALAVGLTIALDLQGGKSTRLIAIFFVGFAVYIVSICRTQCLQCHKPLGWRALLWIPPNALNYSPHCPHCDQSIDSEAP